MHCFHNSSMSNFFWALDLIKSKGYEYWQNIPDILNLSCDMRKTCTDQLCRNWAAD